MLGCLEVQLPAANQLVKLVFEPVLYLRVPRQGPAAGQEVDLNKV